MLTTMHNSNDKKIFHIIFFGMIQHVGSTMCNRKFIIWNRELMVDVEAISAKAAKIAKRLWKKME